MYFHGFENGGSLLFLGFILTSFAMVFWFRDIILEGTFLGNHTKQVQRGLNLGFALFIVSEVMAFFSVFWGFFHASLSPDIYVGSNWPPLGIDALNPFGIPLLNTLLLLSSGAFITYSHHALINGNRSGAISGAFLTIVLAILFTGLQYYEYAETDFTFADSVYGTVFFASTGLHGLHVAVGTIFIVVGFLRLVLYHLTSDHHLGLESAILYWHFVDVV
uniref:cytochrome c oxidase subunit III n=1 Tax=Elmerina hispida TaxID=1245649 RepID=UPI00300351AB|nr:cytochrome c oxidase subunit III [Elmerina hispida]